MLHGGFGSAEQAERSYGWDQLADSSKFVVVYPDGVNRAWNVNGGDCCGRPAREHVDDVAFISAAIADIAKNVRIDAARVYATGMSNGAMMSYTLACTTALFAAIGPVSGTQLDPCRSPHPLSVMAIHGTADPMIPYGGGPGRGFAHINGPAVPELNAFWRKVDQCQAPTETDRAVRSPPRPPGCADRRGVALITVADGGHHWPDFATAKLWEFFAAHPPLSITPLVRLSKKCNIDGMPDTHVVSNQVPRLEDYNPASSPVLIEALIREGGQWGLDEVTRSARLTAFQADPTLGRAGHPQSADPAHP